MIKATATWPATAIPWVKTPNLDGLYRQSLRLTNYHTGTTCSPTRASLMTGRHFNRLGVWHTVMGRSILRAGETTLAEVLGQNGYRTGIFGKWHLGDNYPYRPQDRGFEEVLVHGGAGWGKPPTTGTMTTLMIRTSTTGSPSSIRGTAPMSGSGRR